MIRRNPPLTFNVRIFDVKTDMEERTAQYTLSKVNEGSKASVIEQKERVDKKIASMIKLLIWALNNKKSVEFINVLDDDQED